jgi:sialate O-acetylesterase
MLTALPAPAAAQKLRLSRLITDGMVMQRDIGVPVWGWAAPGDEIAVAFNGGRYTVRAAPTGDWTVTLPPLPAGGPYDMTISDQTDRLHVRDILVGDVWICSGQSNMEFVLADAMNGGHEVTAAHDSAIRQFKVPKSWAASPDATLAGGMWEPADAAHAGDFTAVGYFFARALRETVHVPIGLINTTWGGSRIEPWMSAAALQLDSSGIAAVMDREQRYQQHVLDTLRSRIGGLPTSDSGMATGGRALWADPSFDDTRWATIPVPSLWPQAGYEGFDGAAWYRTTFDLTETEARAGAGLGLGPIDASDITWVNGYEIGRTTRAWNTPRVYDVPSVALRPGRNVIAVRVENVGGGGGIFGDPGLLYVDVQGSRRPLAGAWKFKIGIVRVNPDTHKNQVPTVLYNKMIHPLVPFPIKGALWYQGESNANAADAFAYRTLFARMIEDWRRAWHVGDFPFLFVQLANYMAPDTEPGPSDWAMLRESQRATLALARTGQAVIIDIGEANDIHPKNKQDVGARLALAARRVAYGEHLVASGPDFRRQRVRGARIVVEFNDVGGGLTARGGGGTVHGFAIAGLDRRFVRADAAIEGDHVMVWSDRVPNPVAVRYAWGNNPVGANLFNVDGLPASPFRTDQW